MSSGLRTIDSRDEASVWRYAAAALACVAAALAVVLAFPALPGLQLVWRSNDFYGHAYAIPAVAAYLAFGNRLRIRAALRELRPTVYGPLVVFAVASIQVVALIGDAAFVAGLGIPLLIAATAYAVGGTALLRPLTLPLGFLALMVPPPGSVMDQILLDLKLFVSKTAVDILRLFGETIGREGNTIMLPDHNLFVADACSGLTSIVTMIPLACIVAYFLSRGIWRRAVIVASVIPLAITANIIRVVVTVRMSSIWGPETTQGALHETFGLATFVGGTLTVIAVARVLR